MTKETAKKLLNIYGEAWVTRNPDLIVSIFTDDATYNDPHEPENIG
ncbi:MAG: nuclear transport factor 2 family protein [bacterium]